MEAPTISPSQLIHTSIQIGIDTSNLSNCINFLINNKIPFSLVYANNVPSEDPILFEEQERETPDFYQDNEVTYMESYQKIANSIYEKYINSVTNKIPPSSKMLAQEFNITIGKLKIIFLKYYGKSFYQVYLETKMQQAAKMLLKGYTSNDISNSIGYSHPIKFNKMFQKHFGITPKKYQLNNLRE